MRGVILKQGAAFALPLLFTMSIFALYRGHHEPGGGFVGGLIAAAAVLVFGLAYGFGSAKRFLKVPAHTMVGVGLALAVLSTLIAPVIGGAFFEGIWVELGPLGKTGTPFLFDIGVYLLVVGMALKVLLRFSED